MTRTRRNFIAHWRKFKGLNQPELAERLAEHAERTGLKIAVTEASLSRIETGKQNFNMDFLMAIADVLATGADDPTPGDLLNRNPFKGMLKVLTIIDGLGDGEQRKALDVLQAMFADRTNEYKADDDRE